MSVLPDAASRSPTALRRWRSAGTLHGGCRRRSRSTGGHHAASRPATRSPRIGRPRARWLPIVSGASVGSDAFGIRMVRDVESKPWPKSELLVLLDQRTQQRILLAQAALAANACAAAEEAAPA